MESRLKERLTGAAILVALIVLVVPEMFHGPRSAGPAGATAAAQGPPVHSYTIDLTASTATAHSTPQSAAPSAAQGSAAGPQSGAVSPATGPAASEPGSATPAALSASTAPKALDSPAGAAAAASTAAPQAPAAVSESRAVHGHAATPAGWSVQLGLFAKNANAQRLTLKARAKGFPIRISRTEPKGLYRVWIAGLADRSAAEQMSRKLHAAGLPAAIIRVR
ncbi:MAG: SPOR domain-containing protein [Steroidobacteraceae bacterium]